MNKATRKTVIAGNWKMNMTPSSTKAFITELAPMVAGKDGCDIVLCVPFVDIAPAVEAAKGTNIKIGAENVHFAKSGAYTGEISADMLNEVGAEYVGELLAEREQGITEEIVSLQTKIALQGVSADELKNVIIAYEPVWAIGTGKTATPEQADEVCGIIRGVIAKLYSAEAAEAFTVQYGGSMNAKNAAELLSKVNVDGGLIGGASLKTADFTTIVNAAQ